MAIERTGAAAEHFKSAGENYKDNQKAIAEYTEVIKLLPNDDQSYEGRGRHYLELEQFEKALDDFNKAISLEPENKYHYINRFPAYLNLGETEKAIADVEKAVELAGTDEKTIAIYYYALGRDIEKLTGDKRTAAVYLKKSVEHGDNRGCSQRLLDEWGM